METLTFGHTFHSTHVIMFILFTRLFVWLHKQETNYIRMLSETVMVLLSKYILVIRHL